jgi:glycosyltransferase involved in cell wall biosynthesis
LENAILVTVTKFNAQYLARRGFEGAQVVHCGVVVKREPTPAQEIIRQGPVRMLSVGRLVPKKGHDVLLRALATLAREGLDFECEIIGDGPERHVLEEMVAELDLREMVCMRGSLPHDEVLRRIDRAQIFLLACRVSPDGDADGLPVVLLEAGARAVPIIASSVTGVGEFIDDETGWLVPSGNPEAIANAVREVIRAPEIARERARMAQKRVVDEFSLCAQAQGLASVIDRIPVA